MKWLKRIFADDGPQARPVTFRRAIINLAKAELGTTEVNGSNCGPRVNEYKAATNLPATEPWPWCAAFVCFIVREAMRECGVKETATFKRPRTAGAWDLANWSKKQDTSTKTIYLPDKDILPGDIVIFKFSHVGFCLSSPDANGYLETVEGNTDDEGSREGGAVLRKTRRTGQVKYAIRFMLS